MGKRSTSLCRTLSAVAWRGVAGLPPPGDTPPLEALIGMLTAGDTAGAAAGLGMGVAALGGIGGGTVLWSITAEEAGRPVGVRLRVPLRDGGTREQTVALSWRVRGGRLPSVPVLLCPFCDRRCRLLYLPPREGRLACRGCHRLRYPHQNDSRPAFERAMNRALRPSVGPAAVSDGLGFLQRMDQDRSQRLAAAAWGAPPPDVGRHDVTPAGPVGRPKVRRAYDGAGRRAAGFAGSVGPGEGYCVACRRTQGIVGAEAFVASNGRGGIRGRCGGCGRGLCRMGVWMSL